MPKVQTLAESFKKVGYQAFAVGKMHVYPQRNRIGFDDIILSGEILDMIDLPYGCSFQNRCPISTSECKNKSPKLNKITGVDHEVACHNFK